MKSIWPWSLGKGTFVTECEEEGGNWGLGLRAFKFVWDVKLLNCSAAGRIRSVHHHLDMDES